MTRKHPTKSDRKPKPNPVRLAVTGVLAVAALGTIVALASTMGDQEPAPAAPRPAIGVSPTAAGEVPAPPGVTNPAPYEYHAATDRHYDPNHAHWHAGPPPAANQRGASSGDRVEAPPGITNPTPYQYDAATDRHYDPNHAHWHSGRPPG